MIIYFNSSKGAKSYFCDHPPDNNRRGNSPDTTVWLRNYTLTRFKRNTWTICTLLGRYLYRYLSIIKLKIINKIIVCNIILYLIYNVSIIFNSKTVYDKSTRNLIISKDEIKTRV